jgi:molecular chaperone DnaK
MNTINFGIDLGTTNSLVARFSNGKVEIFKHPVGLKDTLPSVVAFRTNRVLVGDKARELLEKDGRNVFAGFKRKMGTSESFFVPVLQKSISPIELSKMVLQELRTFIYDGSQPESVVITIPASFDTIQSNATKKAGHEAGFKEVVLLQEPIAACLAFANKHELSLEDGNWLVYDLGGGTFDVAIIRIENSELKVVDHKGDNYLGGLDFDNLLVERVLLPQIADTHSDLDQFMENSFRASLEFQRVFQLLLFKAEEAKKELSSNDHTEIEITLPLPSDEEKDVLLSVSREQFNACIGAKVEYSISLVKELLESNQLLPSDVKQVVLVGGSTYIPFVRESIERLLGISVNTTVDPTTAVVVGAGYYAGTKRAMLAPLRSTTKPEVQAQPFLPVVNLSYLKTSTEQEELIMASLDKPFEGFYRITREDGGFDSGLLPAAQKLRQYVPLLSGQLNRFALKLYDLNQNPVPVSVPVVEVTQGKFSVQGQPLPNDICLEVDDVEEKRTKLEVIFLKNSILPLEKTVYRELSKTIRKDGSDRLIVNILEGDKFALPSTNQVIGLIEIGPERLTQDLIKGSDLEIKIQISESREISISVFVSISEQEFKEVFSPSERYVSLQKLHEEIDTLILQMKHDVKDYEQTEDFEIAGKINQYLEEAIAVKQELDKSVDAVNTDEKYHLQERKRRIAQKFDQLDRFKKLSLLRHEYFEMKQNIESFFRDDITRNKFESEYLTISKNESAFLKVESALLIEGKVRELRILRSKLILNSKDHLISLYFNLAQVDRQAYSDKRMAAVFIEQGEKALERQNYDELKMVNIALLNLLPDDDARKVNRNFMGTGIG